MHSYDNISRRLKSASTKFAPDVNHLRRFRGCPIRDKSKKCGVYGFLDLELPSDYYKGLVYSLHEENKALKRMNRMPVGVMDGTSGVVSNNSFGKGKGKVPVYADYDYWNTWVQDETTDEEDEDEVMTTKDEVMTTKDDDLLFYQDTFPVDKFVPFGKAMGSKRIEKSPTIPVAVLGLCNTLTWVEIEKKLRKKPPMKH
ncbi:hypothetical protein Tco_0067003 [Tanacetum coccineum]